VGHQAVLRCLYAYFVEVPMDKLPYINIPLHTVIKLEPSAYTVSETRFFVDIDTGTVNELHNVNESHIMKKALHFSSADLF
jgi:broad specificity phosphatase PhoE